MSSESVLSPPVYSAVSPKSANYIINQEEDDSPKTDPESQRKIIFKSITRGFVFSLMIGGLYIYQKVIRKHYKNQTPTTFFFLFIALSSCNYLMHTFTPEFYNYVISGLGWGVGSVMFKYIIDI